MKIEELAWRVSAETLNLLEEKYHYRISDEHKRGIQQEVCENLNRYVEECMKASSEKAGKGLK
jgi:hypothetical protein